MTDKCTWIKFNVGGTIFLTTMQTLNSEPRSRLYRMVLQDNNEDPCEKDENGIFLLDRDPELFGIILRYLRTKHLIIPKYLETRILQDEAIYYGLVNMVTEIKKMESIQPGEKTSRIYRIISMPLKDIVLTLGEMYEGWKFEQLIRNQSNSNDEYLCIISKKSLQLNNTPVQLPQKFGLKKKK